MSERVIFKTDNEKDFWRYWQEYVSETGASPRYLKISLEYNVNFVSSPTKLIDKSFIYLIDDEPAAIVFLPIEKNGSLVTVSLQGDYVDAPLFEIKSKVEKKLFNLIDKIAQAHKVSKIMFSIDPLEKDRFPYNYLERYNYLDTSILAYLIDVKPSKDLLKSCRRGHRSDIKTILKDSNFKVFLVDKDNPSYELHEEYRKLHHKCSGRETRPKKTFDLQFEKLKQGNAVLFGLKYKGKNVAYSYFEYNADKACYASAADDPDYDKFPLYHILLFSAAGYFQKLGIRYFDTEQPCNPSTQLDYYPDAKELNIGLFKRGFGGDFVPNFRGVKYFSRKVFQRDVKTFVKKYGKHLEKLARI